MLCLIMSLGAKQWKAKCQRGSNKLGWSGEPIWLSGRGHRTAGPKQCDTCSLARLLTWGSNQGSVMSAEVMTKMAKKGPWWLTREYVTVTHILLTSLQDMLYLQSLVIAANSEVMMEVQPCNSVVGDSVHLQVLSLSSTGQTLLKMRGN